MSKEPTSQTNLINGIDASNISRSELIEAIEILKEEIKRLNIKINEQAKLHNQRKVKDKEEFEGPEDIEILKEMIISQREALNERDDEIDELKERNTLLDEYKIENDQLKSFKSQFSDAKSTIDKLTNELNMHKTNEENSK